MARRENRKPTSKPTKKVPAGETPPALPPPAPEPAPAALPPQVAEARELLTAAYEQISRFNAHAFVVTPYVKRQWEQAVGEALAKLKELEPKVETPEGASAA